MPYPHNPLAKQILKPRPDYQGSLTNSRCAEYKNDKCERLDIKAYPLSDEKFRVDANRLGFICDLGGRRFKICLDKPGFCRHWYEGWWLWEKKHEEYIPISDYDFVLKANTRCKSRYE